MLTLWDLLPKALRPRPAKAPKNSPAKPEDKNGGRLKDAPAKQSSAAQQTRTNTARRKRSARKEPTATSPMQERYDRVVAEMLAKYGVRVRRWRSSMSGVAWTITYQDGRVSRLIESPRPKGPMSAAVFLHEIGHHALGIGSFKPRCLEEYHAWAFSLREMEACGLNVTDAVRNRMRRSLEYAVRKAMRRGIQTLPPELAPYAPAHPPRNQS